MKKLAVVSATLLFLSLAADAVPLLTAGDPIIGGQLIPGEFQVGTPGTVGATNNWPAAEPPTAAIDGFGQKYLNFAEFNTGFIVTPNLGGSQGTIATGVQFWTANDAVERDPAAFELYGTNQTITGPGPFALSNFTLISSGALALPASRQPGGATTPLVDTNSQTVSFTNSAPYRSYMVIFPTVKDPDDPAPNANSMQVGEVEIHGTVVPEPSILGLLALSTAGVFALRRRR